MRYGDHLLKYHQLENISIQEAYEHNPSIHIKKSLPINIDIVKENTPTASSVMEQMKKSISNLNSVFNIIQKQIDHEKTDYIQQLLRYLPLNQSVLDLIANLGSVSKLLVFFSLEIPRECSYYLQYFFKAVDPMD